MTSSSSHLLLCVGNAATDVAIGLKLITFDLRIQRRVLDAQQTRGAGLIAFGLNQGRANKSNFKPPYFIVEVEAGFRRRRGQASQRFQLTQERKRDFPQRLDLVRQNDLAYAKQRLRRI